MTRTKIKIKNRRPPRPPHTQTKINEISHQNPKGQGRRCDSVFYFSTTIPQKKYLINFYFSSPFFFWSVSRSRLPRWWRWFHDDFVLELWRRNQKEEEMKNKMAARKARGDQRRNYQKRRDTAAGNAHVPTKTGDLPQIVGVLFLFCFVLFFFTKFSFFFLLNQVESIRRRTPPSEQRDRVHSTRIIRWGFFLRFFCTFTDAQHPHP